MTFYGQISKFNSTSFELNHFGQNDRHKSLSHQNVYLLPASFDKNTEKFREKMVFSTALRPFNFIFGHKFRVRLGANNYQNKLVCHGRCGRYGLN